MKSVRLKSVRSWGLWTVLSLLSLGVCFWKYPAVFPSLDLSLQMDRTQALEAALVLAKQEAWGPKTPSQTATFEHDFTTQAFIELAPQGHRRLQSFLNLTQLALYSWKIRLFRERDPHEAHLFFDPQGRFYGLQEHLPESLPGAALSSEQARLIAEAGVQRLWTRPFLGHYHLVERSEEKKISARVDHFFTYERLKEPLVLEEAGTSNKARYRLRLTVSGDRLTEIWPWIYIPETFSRTYADMRSRNHLLSQVAVVSMILIYAFGIGGPALFFFSRYSFLDWKPALWTAAAVSFCQGLEQLNQFPSIWRNYPTSSSQTEFLFRWISQVFTLTFLDGLMVALTLVLAEALGRRAFPQHLQFWKIWSPTSASHPPVWRQTAQGYLGLGFFSLLTLVTYAIGQTCLGWWSPSELRFHPESLTAYWPGWTPIAHSFHAGLWEEALFRAVPLAGGTLLLRQLFPHSLFRFRLGMVAVLLLQAFIFGAAHANYPTQPFYARLLELILPSLLFGIAYLRWGLLPGVLMHFGYDVLAFAVPLLQAQTPGIWIQRCFVICLAFVPLWVLIFVRRTHRKANATLNALPTVPEPLPWNANWQPGTPWTFLQRTEEKPSRAAALPLKTLQIMTLAGLCFFLINLGAVFFQEKGFLHSPFRVSRQEATRLGIEAIEETRLPLPEPSGAWRFAQIVQSHSLPAHRFVWSEEGPATYQQLWEHFLLPPLWKLRWIKEEKEVHKRGEEYWVLLSGAGKVLQFQHRVPQDVGLRLGEPSETEAKQLGYQSLEKYWGRLPEDLDEVSFETFRQPDQIDWLLKVQPRSEAALKKGALRLEVSGNGSQLGGYQAGVHLPEEWLRSESQKKSLLEAFRSLSLLCLISWGAGCLLWVLRDWSKSFFHLKTFLGTALGITGLEAFNLWNEWPSLLFHQSATEPFSQQIFSWILNGGMSGLLTALGLGLCLGKLLALPLQSQIRLINSEAKTGLWFGLSAGLASQTLLQWIPKLFPSSLPHFPELEALNLRWPLLAGFTEVPFFLWKTSFLFFLCQTARWLRPFRVLSLVFFLLLSLSTGNLFSHTFPEWLWMSSVFFLLLTFIGKIAPLSALPWMALSSVWTEMAWGLFFPDLPMIAQGALLGKTLLLSFLSFGLWKKLSPPVPSS